MLPGDSIYLYTDGVTEAEDPEGNLYWNNRLQSFVTNMVDDIDTTDRNEYCREACERILAEVKSFESDTVQTDDITMLWMKYCG